MTDLNQLIQAPEVFPVWLERGVSAPRSRYTGLESSVFVLEFAWLHERVAPPLPFLD